MVRNPEMQNALFSLRNTGEKFMHVRCEPSCSEYRLEPNSEIVFKKFKKDVEQPFTAQIPIIAEISEDLLTLWFEETRYEPDAEIDGKPTEPFNW
jgi:hypothetical protein